MKYNNLGRAGIKVSELSLGSWLTFGSSFDMKGAKSLMRHAVERGINFFDNAEVYGKGESERIMGQVLKDFSREDLVISTKIYWGGEGPNAVGLSWKRLVEGTKSSLKRLGLDYVDLLFCHRPDHTTPVEETVRAIDSLIRQGCAFYWGTSEWPEDRIREAYQIAKQCNLVAPSMEQPEYSMLVRERVEQEYAPLFKDFGMGVTAWSPLASGILTGKYNNGIPPGSRLDKQSWLKDRLTEDTLQVVRQLGQVAEELRCSLAQLAIAWCLKNKQISTVILGASSTQQLDENLGALEVKDRLGESAMKKIAGIISAVKQRSELGDG